MYSTRTCPFCGTMTTRILDRYQLNAISSANEPQDGVAAYQCANAHVFFVAMEKREPASEGLLRRMHKAAGSS